MYCVTVPLVDRPGAAAGVMDVLAAQNLPIRAYMLGRGRLHLATHDGDACKAALQEGGMDAHSGAMIELDIPDEPGLLAQVFGALADQFINVLVSFGIGTGDQGRIYLMLSDAQRAAPILEQFGTPIMPEA